MGAGAAIAGAVIAAAGTSYSISENEQAKREADQTKDAAKIDQRTMLRSARDREEQEKIQGRATSDRVKARQRQRQMAQAAQGRQGTIMTGGTGDPGGQSYSPNDAGKTLLGG